MNKIARDESAVVIIGSGAGGGTVAYEMTKAGVPCVVLEAGPYWNPEDYVNNEWDAFVQMAWLDPRTTSGSWRMAKDFPGVPAWLVKEVGGTTTHWAGATPRFLDCEFKTLSTYGQIDGATLLDWPISLDELAPYYDKAELRPRNTPDPLTATSYDDVATDTRNPCGQFEQETGDEIPRCISHAGDAGGRGDGRDVPDRHCRLAVQTGLWRRRDHTPCVVVVG